MANEYDEISGLLKGEPGFVPKKGRRKKRQKSGKLKQRRSGKTAAK